MATATFTSKDNNWQDGATTYWFTLTGEAYGMGHTYDGEVFGIVEEGPETSVVDADGCPITDGDRDERVARKYCIVTDEMRAV